MPWDFETEDGYDTIIFDYGEYELSRGERVVGDEPVVMLLATVYDQSLPLTVMDEDLATPESS